jgi:hypothetical protein
MEENKTNVKGNDKVKELKPQNTTIIGYQLEPAIMATISIKLKQIPIANMDIYREVTTLLNMAKPIKG